VERSSEGNEGGNRGTTTDELEDIGPVEDTFTASGARSTDIYKFQVVADSVLRAVNLFRASGKKPPLLEDVTLFSIAMKHSQAMSSGKAALETKAIARRVRKVPLVSYYAGVDRQSTMHNAFTNVVNKWTVDKKAAAAMRKDFNIGGVGVWANSDSDVYVTLILGLRSIVGSTTFSGASLRSVLLAERCSVLVNQARKSDFALQPLGFDLPLCELAFRCTSMNDDVDAFVRKELPFAADFAVGYGRIPAKSATPAAFVENWMNLHGKSRNILGNFNRVGYGFAQSSHGGFVYSIGIYVRSLRAAIVDGSEIAVPNEMLAAQVVDGLNEFREQHGVAALNIDPDLRQLAEEHAEYIANDRRGIDPLTSDVWVDQVQPKYVATDVTHTTCRELSRAPQAILSKWRNNPDCITVLLNQIDDIGIGVAFTSSCICHSTVIIGSLGRQTELENIIYRL
jgi:uncharacterized protein YkwD